MDIDLILKVAGIGTIVAGLIVVRMLVITEIQTLFDTVKSVFGLW